MGEPESKSSESLKDMLELKEQAIIPDDHMLRLYKNGFCHVIEHILSLLDDKSISTAESVSNEWRKMICELRLWRKLIEKLVRRHSSWYAIIKGKGWMQFFFQPLSDDLYKGSMFYKKLFTAAVEEQKNLQTNWKHCKHSFKIIMEKNTSGTAVYSVLQDNYRIISGMNDGKIKFWDRSSLKLIKNLTGHTEPVLCLQSDGKIIVSGSKDQTIRVWDIKTGKMLQVLNYHKEPVTDLRYKQGLIVSCSDDCTIVIWNMDIQKKFKIQQVLVGHFKNVKAVDFDRNFIVSGSVDGLIKVWNTSSADFARDLIGHESAVTCIEYHDDVLATGSQDGTIRLWDISKGECYKIMMVDCPSSLKFDHLRMVCSSLDGRLCVFEMANIQNMESQAICYSSYYSEDASILSVAMNEFSIVRGYASGSLNILDFLPPL